jgi:hypothetical protein
MSDGEAIPVAEADVNPEGPESRDERGSWDIYY